MSQAGDSAALAIGLSGLAAAAIALREARFEARHLERELHPPARTARVPLAGPLRPDILLLQEIKCETAAFPSLPFHGLGYTAEAVGQKSYNGVAVLAREPFTVVHRALPGLPEGDAQARYIEIDTGGITLIGIYLPNGNSRGEEGFA